MRDMQLLHRGRVYRAQVSYEGKDLIEVSCEDPSLMAGGDSVICFDHKQRVKMRVLQVAKNKLVLLPADSEIFRIGIRTSEQLDDIYNDEHVSIPRFKLNTFGTLNDDFKIQAVRFSKVSRLGFGFELNDLSVRMNHMYDSMIILDEVTIHPKLVVSYAHIQENTIHYGAELHSITDQDLNKLRYYVVSKTFFSS